MLIKRLVRLDKLEAQEIYHSVKQVSISLSTLVDINPSIL